MKIPYFKNKIVWITGASSGLGRAMAIEISKHDAYIILSARSEKKLKKTQTLLSNPNNSEVVILDMSNSIEINEVTKRVQSKYGGIDILINNAGISQRSLTIDTEMEVYHQLMNINYFSVIQMSKLLLPNMILNGSGQIVTVTSVNGKLGSYMKSGYAGSKHALHGFFDCLRAEIDGSGVDITMIIPGYTQSNISVNALTKDGSPHQVMEKNTAKGTPADVFAKKVIKQIPKGKAEIVIAGKLESLGLFLKRFWPRLLRKLTANRKQA